MNDGSVFNTSSTPPFLVSSPLRLVLRVAVAVNECSVQ